MSELIKIENEKYEVKLLSLGAILHSFYVKDAGVDIALGLDDPKQYLMKGSASMGKSIGRCANRIGNAKFTLNGVEYKLLANNGPNCLHGGEVSFGDVEWTVKEKTGTKVVFVYESADMESGFPGNMKVETCYELKGDELVVTYEGISDKDTIFNMTNHAYFNFNEDKKDIFNLELEIPATRANLSDEDSLALENAIDVEGTAFDFRKFKKLGDVVNENGVELSQYCKNLLNNTNADGKVNATTFADKLIDNIDTNFLYENDSEKVLCHLKNDKMQLEIKSDLAAVQIYTGKALNIQGKDGHFYGKYAGIAMEPQFCPNAINYSSFMKPILKAGEKVKHIIRYKVTFL